MFLYLLSLIAITLCIIVVIILRNINLDSEAGTRGEQQQVQKYINLTPADVLKIIKRTKPFPVGSNRGWRICDVFYGSRVWKQNLIIDNDRNQICMIAAFCKITASTQVIFHTIKDASRLVDWKPGVTTVHHSNKNGASTSWKDTHVGCDMVTMTMDKPIIFLNNANQICIKRKWHRENNGCCWLLECEKNGFENVFYLVQPLEDLENSSVTILAHLPWCSTVEQSSEYTARLLLSLKDYFLHRKLKSVPLIDIKIPNESLQNNNYVLENDQESSPSDEEMFKSEKTFFQLKPKEQLEILEKSESILKLGLHFPRKRNTARRRSSSDSKSIKKVLETEEQRPRSHTDNDVLTEDTHPSIEKNQVVDENHLKEDNVPSEKIQNVSSKVSESGSDVSSVDNKSDSTELIDSLEVNKPPEYALPLSEPDTIKYMTSANHCAAELQGIAVRISEMDLRKSQKQQSESTNGWIFCGLEHDIVIMNRIFPTSCKIMSYLGKGLIHASPQTVFEAVKNPRTRFMYDESLKRVDILNTITDKIKTVYYYHEILQMFKKGCFDFNILQNERQDGEKYIISMQSIDNGLPVPYGVDRILMLPSGWIIEPVTRDNKIYSMVTYVMQMDFSQSRFQYDSPQLKELISRQPLSIMYLRQYLRPAMMMTK